ncbi:glycosyltransferase family 4 protein [Dietzia sp. PP-33]|nr:glycosyltransferase family 4 protein [Dietzia sp. PP-33]
MTIVCGSPSAGVKRDWAANVEVPARLENTNLWSQVRWAFGATWWTLRNSSKYDAVHVHGAYLFNLLAALPCAILRRPFVILPLAGGGDLAVDSRSSRMFLVRILRRFIVSRSAGGFSLAASVGEELSYWGMKPSRIHSIGNIADSAFFNSSPSWGNQRLVFVGSLSARKRPGLVLDALAELRNRGHDAVGLFVGPFADEETKRSFDQAVGAFGLNPWVTNLGYQEDVVSSMAGSTVFVLPSSQEGLPGALVEAMAMGLPSVVTDVGAMGEVVREAKGGAIVAPNVGALADSIGEILSSEDRWTAMSRSAKLYAAAHFSSTSVSKAYLKTLKEILS